MTLSKNKEVNKITYKIHKNGGKGREENLKVYYASNIC